MFLSVMFSFEKHSAPTIGNSAEYKKGFYNAVEKTKYINYFYTR